MHGVRIHADEHGESHFEDLTFELNERDFAPPAAPMMVSDPQDARSVLLCVIPTGWDGSWHPTPARQYGVLLSGECELEVSDGEVRLIRPGALVLLEDSFGKGHATRVIGNEEVRIFFMHLPE